MTAIQVHGLTKRFGDVVAVDDLSFDVQPGRVTGFLGPNGAGKTTTLRMLLGLVRPTDGTATIAGVPYAELVDPVRHVGAVLESTNFYPGRRARDHLRVLCVAAGLPVSRVDGGARPGRAHRRRRPTGQGVLARDAPTPRPRRGPARANPTC